jgi:hypothetical protein
VRHQQTVTKVERKTGIMRNNWGTDAPATPCEVEFAEKEKRSG